jgi:hypothetical protein
MDARPQRQPALIAAVAAVIFLASMFLDWYTLDLPSQVGGREIDAPSYTAFEGLERSDVALVIAAVLALLFAGVLIAGVLRSSPAPALALLAAGGFVLLVVLYRGTSRPTRPFFGGPADTTLAVGWFVALAAALALVVAGFMAYRAGPRLEFEPFEDEEDELDPDRRSREEPLEGVDTRERS